MIEQTFCEEAIEHLNRVVGLMPLTMPPELSGTADAALFLLRAHREYGTQIRVSVYDYALALDSYLGGEPYGSPSSV